MSDNPPDSAATFSDRGSDLPPAPDGRDQIRHGVDLTVTVDSDHNFIAGSATNLSAGGVFVHTHIVHPVGTKFNISVQMSDSDRPIRGVGVVRWLRASGDDGAEAGLGIQFVELDDDGQERIDAFLAQRRPIEDHE